MRSVLIIISFLLLSCATKHKTIVDQKNQEEATERKEEVIEDSRSVISHNESSGITAYEFSELVGKWSIDYDGEMSDGFRFFFNKTDTGWETGAEGKGTATISQEETKTNFQLKTEWQERFDSLITAYQNHFAIYESRLESLEKEKTTTKKTTGLQAGTYLTIGIVLVIVMVLSFLAWRLKLFRWR